MRGFIEINRQSGKLHSELQAEHMQKEQSLTTQQEESLTNQLTFIMQDLNLYAIRNGGEGELGNLSKISLKLDQHHSVSLTCTHDKIKAQFEPLQRVAVAS